MKTLTARQLTAVVTLILSLFATPATAQSDPPEGWVTPFPAFRVIGPLYGVGMLDLSVFLITSDEGHILINTGLADSTEHIRAEPSPR